MVAKLPRKIRISFRKLVLLSLGGGLAVVGIALAANTVFNVTESSTFCGQVCHKPMYAEYTTYKVSPHSNVGCSSCHVGPGTVNLVASKLHGIPQIAQTITGNYQKPIRAPLGSLRPATQTCEKCHDPKKFSGNLVKTVISYKPDVANTPQSYSLVLKVGGGSSDNIDGIHWHTTSKVWFLPMDDQHFNIGWVGVETPGGGLDEYVNPQYVGSITPDLIKKNKKQMDCIECHNRVTHVFSSPGDLIDKALQDGSIDQSLPFIKAKGVAALDPQNPTLDAAYAKVQAIDDYYKTNYPAIYAQSKDKIAKAIAKLKDIAKLTTFPDNAVNWTTYPDFSGHNKPADKLLAGVDITFDNWKTDASQGCFRCHGTLVPATKNPAAVKMGLGATSTYAMLLASSSSDNSTPAVPSRVGENVTAGAKAGNNSTSAGSSLFGDNVTAGGTTGDNRTGKSSAPKLKDTVDVSCSLCHYSPADKSTSPVPKDVIHPTEKLSDCLACHNKSGPKPIPVDHPWSTNEACVACHKVAPGTLPATKPSELSQKQIPHALKGLEDCLLCHSSSAPKPIKADHPWATNDTCTACHLVSPSPKPLPPSDKPVGFAVSVSHPVNGLGDCLVCHGSSSAKPVPADHPWATNDTCRVCHSATVTNGPLPASSPGQAPAVSHTIQGLSDCLLCHSQTGIRPSPASHSGIPGDFCLLCHQANGTAAPPTSSPPAAKAIPHSTAGLQDCLLCHSSTGIRPYPTDHAGRPDAMCMVCHKPATAGQASLTTGSASGITASSAVLAGNLDSLGGAASATVSFQWGTTSQGYTQTTTSQGMAATGPFQSTLTGLTQGTTYYYRALASTSGGSPVYGAEKSFVTTGSASPAVTTGGASSVTANGAMLNGNLAGSGGASPVSVGFQWGNAAGSYTQVTPSQSLTAAGPFQSALTGLSPATTYYYRAQASAGGATVYGAESSFVTGQTGTPPSVATVGAANVASSSATLQGNFTSLGSATSVDISFQWGTTSGSYTNETPRATMATTAPFQANIAGLTAGTKYYFRAKAAGAGTAYGAEMSFTAGTGGSSGTPAISTSNAINITSTSVSLRGTVDGLGSLTSLDVNFQWGIAPGSYNGQTGVTTMGTTGTFQVTLSGLSSGTTYYFRAKGTDGTTTVYGSEISFTTP